MRGFVSILLSCAIALVAFEGADAHPARTSFSAHHLRRRSGVKPLRARACRSHPPSASAAAAAVIASSSAVAKQPAPATETPAASPISKPKTTSVAKQAQATTHAAPAPATTTKAASSSGSSSNSGSSSSSSSGGTVSSSDIQAYLNAHNTVRAQHGAGNLVWNNTLEAAAQKWANNCVFQHSGGTLGPFGENLAAGTGDFTIQAGVQDWANEASQYNPSNPVPSHFTQMVWKGSNQLGCAVASCQGIFASSFGAASFYVCEYFPQGNVIGEFAQEVSA